jgi:hypothetical protein
MKIEDVARPGLLVLGVVGVAATALLGFAAGVAVARDPEVLRRTARGLARGVERATLMAAQAREHVGDLWAEAREEALAEVDAADFERAAAKASPAAPAGAAAAAPRKAARKTARKTARKSPAAPSKPRAPRKPAAQVDTAQATHPN